MPDIDPITGERIPSQGSAPQIDPNTGERMGASKPFIPEAPKEGFFHSLANSLGISPEQQQAQHDEAVAHPIKTIISGAAGPLPGLISGAWHGLVHSSDELGQAINKATEKNPAGVAQHLMGALPFIGSDIEHGADQLGPGENINRASFGTSLGTALKTAPMLADAMSPITKPIINAPSTIRTAAIGDPDVALLKAMRVGSGSKQGLSTIKSGEGARPYLQGAKNLSDLQSKVPAAKSEIWGPYQDTVDAISGKKVQGPDGPTTVGDLEKQRLEISANLRALKTNGPEAIRLAQQKGMSQAELLAQEKAVQGVLDPHLEQAGIDPKQIRQTFGQVARIGSRVEGRTTLPEKSQPYGIGKVFSSNPFTSAPGEILSNAGQGIRDVVAGRPLWSGKPTDVAVKDAFRLGGQKPDFRSPSMPAFQAKPLQLPSSTIGNADFGNVDQGSFPARPVREGQAPPSRLSLPAVAGGGETQPMIGVLKHPGGQRGFTPEITRISPANNGRPPLRPSPGGGFAVGPDGTVRKIPAMLPGHIGTPSIPAESLYRGDLSTPLYPAASQFRTPGPRPWTPEELEVLNRKGISK